MKRTRVVTTALSFVVVPVVLASCTGSTPPAVEAPAVGAPPAGTPMAEAPGAEAPRLDAPRAEAPADAPGAVDARQVEREVTLHVDPAAGTIAAAASSRLLAVIEADLALDFDLANLRHAEGRTSFLLVARNRGSGVTGLSFRTTGERAMTSPAQPVVLGDLGPGSEATQTLTFDNASGGAFTITLWLSGTLVARGAVGTDGAPASSAPTPAPTAAPTAAPTQTPTQAPTASPTASPTPAPTATPTPAPTATPTPSTAPSGGPTATPTTPPGEVANPGPLAARGRILMNGKPSYQAITLSLIRNPGWVSKTVTTDAQGYFTATGLEPGDYLAYFYNDSNRERIGYWRSRSMKVDATTGAAFPTVDFYQKGLVNDPPMDARRALPVTFTWVPQTQTVDYYRFRLHSTGGRTFTLVHQSNRIPGTETTFTWDGSGVAEPLSSTNRYFWGLFWDAGPVGEGGNLYQAIYFNP